LVTLLVFVWACTDSSTKTMYEENQAKAAPAPKPAPPPAPAASREPVGAVEGVIEFQGTPPVMPELDRFAPNGAPKDKACSTKETAHFVRVSGGGVQDVVIRVAVASNVSKPAPSGPAVIDQKNCLYTPFVLPVVAGQKVEYRNSDKTVHNIHTYVDGETDFNEVQPKPFQKDVPTPAGDTPYLVRCDFHPWMEAHVLVSDNPWFTTSDAGGKFKLFLPPGKHKLQAWHPYLGTRTADVTVTANNTVKVSFPAFTPADYKAPKK
jgi:plastocyanin